MITHVWGEIAPVVASLIVTRPTLAASLVLAPTRIVHVLGAYVQHAHAAQQPVNDIADALERQHVRDLLACAIPNAHSRLRGMLGRMGPTVFDLKVYARLSDLLHGPASDLIQTAVEITPARLELADQIVADPVLLAAHKAIGWTVSNLETLQHALTFLRTAGLANDIEALPPGSGWRAILRRISSDLGRARAPALPFAAPAGWRHIESVAGLWQAGTALGNCVANVGSGGEDYIADLISGDAAYLVYGAEPTMLARIRRVGPNLWVITEKSMSRAGSAESKATGSALTSGLTASIAATGGRLLDQAPMNAIRHIAWRAGRTAEDDLDELADAA